MTNIRRLAQYIALLTIAVQSNTAAASEALETVLVTATRAETPASELPLAWSSLSGEDISFTAPQHSSQLFQQVAGAWISRGNGQESLISLRSPVLAGTGSCGAFMTAADGISLRAPGFCNVNQLFDANLVQAGAVEVIRGPATAVYGSNAMHGVINVLTAGWAQTDNSVSVEGGSRDFYRARIGLSSEETGLALNAQVSEYGGFQDASGYEQQKFSLRHDGELGAWSMTSIIEGSNLNQETAGYIQGDEAYKDSALRTENPNPEAYRDAWSMRAHVTAQRELGDGYSLTLTPYWRKNSMEFLQHFVPWQPVERNGHDSIGLQAAVNRESEIFNWIAGIDLDVTDGWLSEYQAEPFSPNQPQGVHYDYQVDATVIAPFVQGTWAIDEKWRVDSGLRVESTQYDYDNLSTDGDACAPSASACRFYRPADRSDDFSDWNGNLALSYQLQDARIYGRVARGFRAPQTGELYRLQAGQRVADINSEQIDSFELGVRGNWRENLAYSVNGYWMEKDDVIFQDRDRQNVSGAATTHRGIEVELNWQIDDVWYAALAGSIARHRYASPTELIGSSGDIEGNMIDTAPKHFGSARVGFDLTLQGMPLKSELEFVWLDEYFVDPNNENSYSGHELLNLRTDWAANDTLSLSLVITNLLDEDYAERADFGFGQYRYFVGEPRSAVLGVSFNL
jgi:outer membrane receptor protein involved in Fe transport